jgi:hypothetical protein
MKKFLLLLCMACAGMMVFSQSPVPNGNFEIWTSSTFGNPQYYPNTSNSENFFRYHLPFNVTRTTDAYHGTYAVQLTTNASALDTAFGYFINISPDNAPTAWTGGMPYDQMPTGIRGWYKYNVATADSGTIIVAFSHGGTNIGTYFVKLGGIHSDYTLFNYAFNPGLSVTPDSVAFGAISCNFSSVADKPHGPAGSTLVLDSVTFTGVTSQPLQMNGDFETWQGQTIDIPNDWYAQSENGAGFGKTNDAAAGDYALELKTYSGSQNNHALARPGWMSTGYFPEDCNGNCMEMGGYPFTSQQDTLIFYYKYAPALPADNAWININLKKEGSQFWSQGMQLPASAEYSLMEFPFNAPQAPDSVIIDIQSSLWQDTTLAYVGAVLKIDDILFKSQILPTGILNNDNGSAIRILPNPTNGWIQIQGLKNSAQRLEIYNESGKIVYSSSGLKRHIENEIDLSGNAKGIYFLKIYDEGTVQTEKFVIQ